jgi:hypothetical protein
VLDFDHLGDHGKNPEAVINLLKNDERVVFAFISPSGDGVKAVFRLQSPITDAKLYSDFYRGFAASFGRQKVLGQCCDISTSDVSRVCFLSHDPTAHYNPNATAVAVPETMVVDHLFGQNETEPESETQDTDTPQRKQKNAPNSAAMDKIKERLLQKPQLKKPRTSYFVPDQVRAILPGLKDHLASNDLEVYDEREIQYGIKIATRFSGTELKAQANIYFGKKGYSVVITSSAGSNKELRQLLEQLIWEELHKAYRPDEKIIKMQAYG